ncbi:MAG: hypothetical protein IPH94_19215 [Saprospiraceae bacterium]|nr:hypothetical protein [Saprospiraceae bacterium]
MTVPNAGTTLNLSSSGGSTYSWSGPNMFSNDQNPTITNVTSAAAEYTLPKITDGNGMYRY